jgi:hypothetical protein
VIFLAKEAFETPKSDDYVNDFLDQNINFLKIREKYS